MLKSAPRYIMLWDKVGADSGRCENEDIYVLIKYVRK